MLKPVHLENCTSRLPDHSVPAGTRGAVVLGGSHGALAVVRSLGRANIPVVFLDRDHSIAKYSRYLQRSYHWSGPFAPRSLEFLLDIAAAEGLLDWVLIPCGDAEARMVAENHVNLSRFFCVPSLPWERMKQIYDKKLLYGLAGQLGLAYPRLITTEQLEFPAAHEICYPVVIKPTASDRENALTRDKAWKAEFPDQLAELYGKAVALMGRDNVVVQEMIPGDGRTQFSYAGVWHDGAPVASLVARRTRQFPREFGYTSTFVETIESQAIEEAASALLAVVNYSGLVEVEFKYDLRDRCYKVLDVNCRAWTWLGLGAAAGLDFATILWRLGSGERVGPTRGVTGVAWTHLSRDLLIAMGGPRALALKPGAYLKQIRRVQAFAAWAADDPLPGLVDLPLLAPRLARRLWRKWNLGDRTNIKVTITKILRNWSPKLF